MNQYIFIIVLLIILIFVKIYNFSENFMSNENPKNLIDSNDGIYNYFYQIVMNPYKYSLTPFFSNDSNLEKIQKSIQKY